MIYLAVCWFGKCKGSPGAVGVYVSRGEAKAPAIAGAAALLNEIII